MTFYLCHFLCLEDFPLIPPLVISLTLIYLSRFSSNIIPFRECSPKLQYDILAFIAAFQEQIIIAHLSPDKHLMHFSFITTIPYYKKIIFIELFTFVTHIHPRASSVPLGILSKCLEAPMKYQVLDIRMIQKLPLPSGSS